jgi:trans-aconitate methyltransferase
MSDDTWVRYYQAVQGREPRAPFLAALAAFEADGFDQTSGQAVDLGCGDGTETMALLARGWCVLAVDRELAAIERVLAALPEVARPRLETQVTSFENAVLPPADFVYAGLSLPFCPPEHFPAIWERVVAAVRPGGRFAGHLFGERDSWNGDPTKTFHTAAEFQQRFAGFTIESLNEVENDRPTALGEPKHWHVYEVVARRGR